MPADNSYLIKRHKTWYVKVAIPPSIRHLYNGKHHIVRSLKTRDQSEARDLPHAMAIFFDQFA